MAAKQSGKDPAIWRFCGFWVKKTDAERLRTKFPGNKDGIRWRDVVSAALSVQPRW